MKSVLMEEIVTEMYHNSFVADDGERIYLILVSLYFYINMIYIFI